MTGMDDLIDVWHKKGITYLRMQEWLGLTNDEYNVFVIDPARWYYELLTTLGDGELLSALEELTSTMPCTRPPRLMQWMAQHRDLAHAHMFALNYVECAVCFNDIGTPKQVAAVTVALANTMRVWSLPSDLDSTRELLDLISNVLDSANLELMPPGLANAICELAEALAEDDLLDDDPEND